LGRSSSKRIDRLFGARRGDYNSMQWKGLSLVMKSGIGFRLKFERYLSWTGVVKSICSMSLRIEHCVESFTASAYGNGGDFQLD